MAEASSLQKSETQKKFHDELQKLGPANNSSTTDAWTNLVRRTKQAAGKALKRGRLPQDRDCRKLVALICKYKFWMSWKPSLAISNKLSEVTSRLKVKLQEVDEKKCEEFFKNLHQYPFGSRINRTHKYLKKHRKQKSVTRYSTIPISDWTAVGEESVDGLPEQIPETDGYPLPASPTVGDIRRLLDTMANGKASGQDRLPTEYLKYADCRCNSFV